MTPGLLAVQFQALADFRQITRVLDVLLKHIGETLFHGVCIGQPCGNLFSLWHRQGF